MIMAFTIKHTGEHLRIKAEPQGYSLIIIDAEPVDWVSITFDLPLVNDREVMVTGRDIKHYDPQIQDISIHPSKVYLEVGAGLGEFIPRAAQQNPVQRPIVIDPVNYALMLEMLECAGRLSLRDDTKRRLQLYQERCRVILNLDKVQLINNTLEDALMQHPELRKTADIVVDHYAAAYHSQNPETTLAMELLLLKPQGKLYSFLPQR